MLWEGGIQGWEGYYCDVEGMNPDEREIILLWERIPSLRKIWKGEFHGRGRLKIMGKIMLTDGREREKLY